ncbi:hypothetical protein [Curvivirga sp.]|uniref:hypothetical protein n=1 Tax=Curvivirga sp. TaxID=2856848 RepID=UPI003B58E677
MKMEQEEQYLKELLQLWSSLSDAQRAAFRALTGEVDIATNLMEAGVSALSSQFQSLANSATKLSSDMYDVLQDADKVPINGELVPLEDTILQMEHAIDELVSEIAKLSDQNSGEKIDKTQIMVSLGLTESLKAVDHLGQLKTGLEDRHARFLEAVTISLKDSRGVAEDITKLTTTIQFQDRTSQRLQHIKDSLEVIGEMLQKIDSETTNVTSGIKERITKEELLSQLIAGFNLAEVKERFIRAALRGETIDDEISKAEHLESSDDIDLF